MPFLLVVVLIFIGWIILLNIIYALQKALAKCEFKERRILYFLQFFFCITALLIFILQPVTPFSEPGFNASDSSQAFRINDYYLLLNIPGMLLSSLSTTHPPFRPGRNTDLLPILIQALLLTFLLLLIDLRYFVTGFPSNPWLIFYTFLIFTFLYFTTGFKVRKMNGVVSKNLSILPAMVLLISLVFVFVRFQLLDFSEFYSHG